MKTSLWGKGIGLVSLGFLSGVIVSNAGQRTVNHVNTTPHEKLAAGTKYQYQKQNLGGQAITYDLIASTADWDILQPEVSHNGEIALGQNGQVRIVVVDDAAALHVLLFKNNERLWEGRLLDIGNDGSVEVADISGSHCEKFP